MICALRATARTPLQPCPGLQGGSGLKRSTAIAVSLVASGMTIAGFLGIVAVSAIPAKHEPSSAVLSSAAPSQVPPADSTDESQSIPLRNSETIVIKPSPHDATTEVNGIALGAGTQSFSRPKPGIILTVVVRAPGYATQTIAMNHMAESEWLIDLVHAVDASTGDAGASKKAGSSSGRGAKGASDNGLMSPPHY